MASNEATAQRSTISPEVLELSMGELESVSAGLAPLAVAAARIAIRVAVVVAVASLGGSTSKK